MKACYLFQLLDERVHGSVGFGRAGHVHVQFITVSQRIQTQNKCHIVMQQTGLWGRKKKRLLLFLSMVVLQDTFKKSQKTHRHGPDYLQSISLCPGNYTFLLQLRRTLNDILKRAIKHLMSCCLSSRERSHFFR